MPSHFCKVDSAYPRLDRYISENLSLLSRSQIKARKLKAILNGKEVKLSRNVEPGDNLKLLWEDSPPENIIPQDIPLDIIYEDNRCIVVNKAQNMVVHPGAGNRQGTLANAILFRMNDKLEGMRPGIVHRLDKDTSGVIIAAYDEEAHEFLASQFKNRKVRKTYIAIVSGSPKEQRGKIETFIARDPKDRKKFAVCERGQGRGKNALTFYKVIKNLKDYSLVLLRPRTGRTHQLRVHMRHLGCPILGDSIYGKEDKGFPSAALMLHAKKLEITLAGENQPRVFSAPVPQRFKSIFKIFL
ncbi:MAG: RluA family pseudouridine synthase [Treponema sp.]|jgi:23S rRNA pseudouridine1911/1915/1917 synthase|nr:RluA family pseudouridine synthase [Treponema sp.]